MKVFNNGEDSWNEKVNFVDENNLFVGYDMSQSCCENAGWLITDTIKMLGYEETSATPESSDIPDLSSYRFDPDFFVDAFEVFGEAYSNQWEGGGHVVFRLVSESGPDLYLNLYNSHNGYYSHGFEYGQIDGEKKGDSL